MTKYFIIPAILFFLVSFGNAQEVYFFDEGTDANFYDQGIVDVNNLGGSSFEHTYPPGGSPSLWNDKVPCSAIAFKGNTSLKFNYVSAENGNWKVNIHRKSWAAADISTLDSLSFYIYSETELPKTALPLIGMFGEGGTSELYALADFNNNVPAAEWTRITFPLDTIIENNPGLDFTQSKAVVFNQSESNNSARLLLIDEITAFKSIETVPPVTEFLLKGYDSHVDLSWTQPTAGLLYRVYASFDGGQTFDLRKETSESYYLDFVPATAKNSSIVYKLVAVSQNKESEPNVQSTEVRGFSDDELLNMIQEYSFRYFWEGAHQASGMALERSNGNGVTAASGATGFGLMAMIVAHEREYRPKEEIKDRIIKILKFLDNCEKHHGAWSHWYNADTYRTQPFTPDDDGGDLVETSFVAQALVALKNYFSGTDAKSVQIRGKADKLWKEIEWDWYRNGNQNVLFWHWSPNTDFQKNMKVSGWNECLGTYIMAASSPTFSIPKSVYTNGWAQNGNMVNPGRTYYGLEINLARNWGGPLFWIHYSHHGINPRGLTDEYANYWQEHVNTAKIHYEYAKANPLSFENYSENCWGLTASDDPDGYTAHKPMDNDNGTVSPTAALASMPYTPVESLKALNYFYRERGAELFGKYGPYDAFNDSRNWVKESYIGIDQGPIVIMIENYRTGLLWKNVMKDADVQAGLDKLGFQYEVITETKEIENRTDFVMYPNPASDKLSIKLNTIGTAGEIKFYAVHGALVKVVQVNNSSSRVNIDCSDLTNGVYVVQMEDGKSRNTQKLIIRK
ncbi:glucoamylase family protein [uncultured Draconibacterium sp.]|uniref:glucoamylase family protein n=1 Tax=uncultured Draconibacterium sp. TaxID=1573823 RepID=UPI003216F061